MTRAKLFSIFIVLIMVAGLIGPVGLVSQQTLFKAHPLLTQLAAEQPDQLVAVIVQKLVKDSHLEVLVAQLGGVVTRDLHIINAFAAKMEAQAALALSRDPGVRWVSLDAPVERSGKPVSNTATFTIRDDFMESSFYNNDGTAGWKNEWQEDDVTGAGPTSGNVLIYAGELFLDDQPDTGTQPSLTRGVNLSDSVTSATLSFYFRVGQGAQSGQDVIALDISKDGGLSYTTVSTMSYNGGTTGSSNRNILAYASADTRIRFRVQSGFSDANEYFALDYVQIEYIGNALPNNTYLDTLRVRDVWNMGITGAGIGVAVIDSGITKERDFSQRVTVQRSFNPNSTTVNDVYGHGTHVAGIIGADGSGSGGVYYGIAPSANLISLKVSDEIGMAYESDVVAAIQWVYDNKNTYNIRVVNLSINSTIAASYHTSPLSTAVEVLWFNGVVVVASAGNYWSDTNFNPVLAAPANDPFIITVGATDEKGTSRTRDDVYANFSAFGTTLDGHYKPDIYAPGKNIISALSARSDWDQIAPERVVAGKYFRLSGTSMAAPMVAGAAALLLQDEPNLTPDQVKYRLINTASWIGPAKYLDVYAAVTGTTTASANTGLTASQLLWTGSEPITWGSVAWNSVAWNSVAWNSVAWNSVAWNSVAWNSVAWND